jgi:aldehyde dehydrogenase (NAD+)
MRLVWLVTLEMARSSPEGDGEVQEMTTDFAVGCRACFTATRCIPSARAIVMYEFAVHPLGLVGVVSAFNFRSRCGRGNAFLAAICGDITI